LIIEKICRINILYSNFCSGKPWIALSGASLHSGARTSLILSNNQASAESPEVHPTGSLRYEEVKKGLEHDDVPLILQWQRRQCAYTTRQWTTQTNSIIN